MQVGQMIKTRTLRSYFRGKEARGWAEFKADNGTRNKEEQRGFVLFLLGTEPLHCTENEELDPVKPLNKLGWWSETQLISALGEKKAKALVQKMSEGT